MNVCPTNQQLSAYHDGELAAADAGSVSAHVAACDHCSTELNHLRQMSGMFAAIGPLGGAGRISQIALRRLHNKLDEVIERGLVRWAWEVSGIAAAVLLVGSIWLSQAAGPSNASASLPPFVAPQASADPIVRDEPTPAAAWYLVDARNSSDVSP